MVIRIERTTMQTLLAIATESKTNLYGKCKLGKPYLPSSRISTKIAKRILKPIINFIQG